MPRQPLPAAEKAAKHGMGFFSTSAAISRFRVEGEPRGPLREVVREGLVKNAIDEIDNQAADKTVGWTRLETPFEPNFDDEGFAIADFFLFALRIDKKSIPPKVIKKHLAAEMARRKRDTGRDFLSRSEKQMVKEHVLNVLSLRIPATPNVYDILWRYNENELWLFSTQKAANEELESLFAKSFHLSLIRLFPYTLAEFDTALTDAQRDVLNKLTPCPFAE
jgi:DNA recombination-dependent growth factor C